MIERTAGLSEAGVSLIELMIAILVSTLLLAGVIQVMLSKKDSYNFQQAQAKVQESARFSVLFLDDILEKTGYRQQAQASMMNVFRYAPASADCAGFNTGQVVTESLVGDGICIRYQEPVADDVDCAGRPIGDGVNNDAPDYREAVIERIYYQAGLDGQSGQLFCGRDGGDAFVLVGGVEDFRLRYGIDDNGDRMADKFIASPDAAGWRNIVSLRFDLLSVAEGNLVSESQSYRFPFDAPADTTAGDRRLYRVATQTITLRNVAL